MRSASAAVAEAIPRDAGAVDLRQGQRRQRIRGDDGAEIDAVVCELVAQAIPEGIAGDAAEVCDRPIKARDRPGDVVRTAARMRTHAAVRGQHQVDECLARHHDRPVASISSHRAPVDCG